MIFRAVIIATIIAAVALAAAAFRNQQRIAALHETRERLALDILASGVSSNAHDSAADSRSRRTRDHGPSDADAAIAAILAYAREIPQLDTLPEPDRLKRVARETERIQQLGARQLRTLDDALLSATDLEPEIRDTLSDFILSRLAHSHPHDTFERLLARSQSSRIRQTLNDIIFTWAVDAPDQAHAALADHLATIPPQLQSGAKAALLAGMLLSDPATARQLSREAAVTSGTLQEFIRGGRLTPDQQAAAKAVLESWSAPANTREPSPDAEEAHPVAKRIPGKPGFVLSPYTHLVLDVSDYPSGSLVRDPTSPGAQIFRVP